MIPLLKTPLFGLISVMFIFSIDSGYAKSASADENIHDKLTYTITIDAEDDRLATVSVEFTLADSVLYMDAGASQLPKRWAEFVYDLKAENASGEALQLDTLAGARWIVHSPLHERIKLTYEVRLEHENYEWSGGIDGIAYANEWGVFYTGRALFILNGEDRKDIDLDFRLPDNWKITAPWELKDNPNSFSVSSLTELTQSMFFAGTHQEFSIKREAFELVFALGGTEVIAQQAEFEKMAEGIFDYYIDLMGGTPNPDPANAFKKTVVIINSGATTDGEVVGNHISILIEPDGDKMSEMISRFIFAHEFFHLWNAKSFFPVDDSTEWFKEGFTNYYTIKALHHIGYLNDQSYLGILNDFFYQRYINDSGIGTLSMTDGEAKHDHWGIIYGGGLFVSICQDIIIRKATDNQKSIDDLMRALYQKYGGTSESYDSDELRELMTELSGLDQSDFFENYIIGAKEIPIADYFNMLGLEAKTEDKKLIISVPEELTDMQQSFIDGLFGEIDRNE